MKTTKFKQILLAAVAVLGLAAGAQTQTNDEKPSFHKNELEIGVSGLPFFDDGLHCVPFLAKQYNRYITPRFAIGIKIEHMFVVGDILVGIKYDYFNYKAVSLKGELLAGIVNDFEASLPSIPIGINLRIDAYPFELYWNYNQTQSVFLKCGVTYSGFYYGLNDYNNTNTFAFFAIGYNYKF